MDAATKKFIDDTLRTVGDTLVTLYGRWQDEKEYEDFGDYRRALKTRVENVISGARYINATKRPFGITFAAYGFVWRIYVDVRARSVRMKATGHDGATQAERDTMRAMYRAMD